MKRLFIIGFEDDPWITSSYGKSALDALQNHYSDMGMYCSSESTGDVELTAICYEVAPEDDDAVKDVFDDELEDEEKQGALAPYMDASRAWSIRGVLSNGDILHSRVDPLTNSS